jgi:phosphate transport system protein
MEWGKKNDSSKQTNKQINTMPVHLTNDLNRLKKDILEYGAAVDQNFVNAIKALEVVDNALATRVIDHDQILDRTEVEIEDKCLKLCRNGVEN